MRIKAISAAILLALATPASADPPAELVSSVTAMGRIGRSTSPTFSPDGSQIAFLSSLSGSPQVWVMPVEGGFPRQVTALEDAVDTVRWSPTSNTIAFTIAPAGGLNTQIFTVNPDGTGMRRITAGGRENNFFSGWTEDGSALAFSSNTRDSAATDPYLWTVATGQTRRIAQARGLNGVSDVSDDGRWVLISRLVSRGDNDLYLVNASNGRERLLTRHTPPAQFGWGEFAPDGRSIYITSNADRERAVFARIPLNASGAPGRVQILAAREDAEADSASLNPQGTMAALFWNVAGRTEMSFLDTATGVVTPGPTMPAELAGNMAWSRDGRRIALVVAGAAATQDIHILNVGEQTLRQVTFSPTTGVDRSAFVRPELITYRAHDGLELSGWLYRPANFQAPGPVVFSYHGGPEGQERPVFRTTYQALLTRGIAVFAPNVRGSSGFGRTFVNLDNGALRENGVRDIEATTNAILAMGVGDPQRLGIMGGSYGGYMVMAGVTQYPQMFAAGVNMYGVVNFETFFAQSEPWMAAISTVEYGNPATEADMLRRLSPIHNISRVQTPLLVMHGANDTNVPVVEAEQVVEGLRARNVPVEYILFPDEGHGWRKTNNRIRSDVALVDFFERHLVRRE